MEQLPAYRDRNESAEIADPDTVTSTDIPTADIDLGSLPGAVMGTAVSVAGEKLGVPSGVTSAATAAAKTDSFAELQDSLMSSVAGIIGREVAEAALPGVPGVASLTGAVASEATKSNPNFGATALSSIAKTGSSLVGTAVAGPWGGLLGGLLGGYAMKQSLDDGFFGDITDVRSREDARDRAETLGFSRDQTADAASVDAGRGAFAGSGYSGIDPGVSSAHGGVGLSPGLSDLDSGVSQAGRTSLSDTPSSAISNAAQGALGQFAGLDVDIDTDSDGSGSSVGNDGDAGRGDAPGADSAGNSAGQGQGGSSGAFA